MLIELHSDSNLLKKSHLSMFIEKKNYPKILKKSINDKMFQNETFQVIFKHCVCNFLLAFKNVLWVTKVILPKAHS